MWTKRILIFAPLVLTGFLFQSFFWVPTYENQAKGNPQRLIRYIQSSGGDAQILNSILSADSSSSVINDLVFDGLIDYDDQLNFRPRLAESWIQYEEAYLTLNLGITLHETVLDTPEEWLAFLKKSLAENEKWMGNIKSWELVPAQTFKRLFTPPKISRKDKKKEETGQVREIKYTVSMPPRIKFTLKKIDQDFFKPVLDLIGKNYEENFHRETYIQTDTAEDRIILKPKLAEWIPILEHNPVIEFHLRKGVLFHDGHEFDSGDVLFTYRAIMNPKNASPRTSDYEPVKSAVALSPYRIRFTYKRLFSPAINAWMMGILPEHLFDPGVAPEPGLPLDTTPSMRESDFNRHPIGTGPFKFAEWKSDVYIRLVSNGNYWDSPPEYKEFVMRIIPDPLTQEMEFYTGAVDNYQAMPHQIARFKQDEAYQHFSSIGSFYSYIGYNLRNPLFADRRVRKALGMAIDTEKIIKFVLYGEGERVNGPYPKVSDWYDPDVAPIPYDPKGALKILEEVGWKKNADGFLEKDGKVFEFNLITNSGNAVRKNILAIAQNSWRKIGIKCNTQFFEWAVFLTDFVNKAKFDALVLGWSMGYDPDLFQLWHSSQTGPQQLNFVGYKNPEADALILRIRKEYDRNVQIRLARKLHRLIARDQPYTFLYVAKSTKVLDKRIVIVESQPDGSEQYKKIYPTKDGRIDYYFNKWKKLGKFPQMLS